MCGYNIVYSSSDLKTIIEGPTCDNVKLTSTVFQLVNQLGINKKAHRGKSKRHYAPVNIPVMIGNRRQNPHPKHKRMCVMDNLIKIETQKVDKRKQKLLPGLFYTNCRSLNEDKHKELLQNVESHHPEIIGLTETWLHSKNEHTANIPGYKLYTSNRSNRIGGGVCIYTRATIAANKVASYTSRTTSAVWIKAQLPNIHPIIYACIYHPPSATAEDTLDHLCITTQKLMTKHKSAKFVICGDFNRLDVDSFQRCFNLTQIVDFNTRGDSRLDLILTDVTDYEPPQKLAPLVTNDHCCMMLNPQRVKSLPCHILRRCISKSARISLCIDVAQQDWSQVLSAPSVNEKVEIYDSIMNTIVEKHCPVRRLRVKQQHISWQTPLIMKIRKAKNRAFSKGSPAWKYLAKLLKSLARRAQRDHYDRTINSLLAEDQKCWWKSIKALEGNASSSTPEVDKHFINNEWMSSQQLADSLNDYYLEVGGTAHPITIDLPESKPGALVSCGEVKHLLTKIKTKKATHSKDYPSWITRACAEDVCVPITDIINNILAQNEFPQKWKSAEIKPLPKVPTPAECKDYRPISLLYHLSKVTETIMMKRYRSSIEGKLHQNQFAYTRGLSTTDALVETFENCTKALDEKSTLCVSVILKDFSKAFDKMQPSILLEKLQRLECDANVLLLAKSFLENRTQQVVVNRKRSTNKVVNVGVPQGTISGPMFWLVFVDDLQPATKSVKYADDTTCYAPISIGDCTILESTPLSACVNLTSNVIQDALDYSQNWCLKNGMLLNATKTKILNLSVRKKITITNSSSLNGVDIETVPHAKLLGVTMDEHLTFSAHVQEKVDSASKLTYTLVKLKRCGLAAPSLVKLYCSKIRPVISYAAPGWFTQLSAKSVESLESVQRLALKVIYPDLNSYRERLKCANISTLCDYLQTQCKQYFDKILESEHRLNPLLPYKTGGRQTRQIYDTNCRTQMRKNSLLMKYCS